jgi:hypothetical protein
MQMSGGKFTSASADGCGDPIASPSQHWPQPAITTRRHPTAA